ncbi:hypothetical protein [Occultella kanbiaonis]|uniref:hypothetical protein n=1 Tax=Occultella kanbiaonis TaxID=2675754 RepID=UPI0013D56743|nr:hypothetical protein [Occultella kanbiaonis]
MQLAMWDPKQAGQYPRVLVATSSGSTHLIDAPKMTVTGVRPPREVDTKAVLDEAGFHRGTVAVGPEFTDGHLLSEVRADGESVELMVVPVVLVGEPMLLQLTGLAPLGPTKRFTTPVVSITPADAGAGQPRSTG